MISEVGNTVGNFTNRRDTIRPRFNFSSFLWVGNEKSG
jgi:hypothetical protein